MRGEDENGGSEWGGNLISLLIFEIAHLTEKNQLKRAKYLPSANTNLTSWSISKAIINWRSSCASQNI